MRNFDTNAPQIMLLFMAVAIWAPWIDFQQNKTKDRPRVAGKA